MELLMHGLISSPATKHRAMRAPGRARIQGEQRRGVKGEGSGETLVVVVV